ncbi:M14 family zinc carboxypeptidase [uncultured Cetobacterium sp.]|uniref:M14 family zinc carboxypeptidase n=1 Tax=uncultured Cetobacterium sp. TaxID=527638 RepID=UPI0026362B3F|nr:M14 family zinc carboxypeptidase [uncultured Cetobacterium sp.]
MKKTVVLQSVCIFFISITSIIAFPGKSYKEPASIKSFFPDTTPMVKTPATLKNRSEFTTQKEMLDYLGAIHTTNKNTTVDLLGPTVKGNYLPIIMFSKEKKDKPRALLIAQQHGDEPMGCDVLLGTVKRITHGDLNYLLEKIDIVIMPRVNPDGAKNFTRTSSRKLDINDDHVELQTIEANIIREVYDKIQPEVFIDIHEYIADEKSYSGILKDGALPYYDILGLNTTNINYPQELKNYSTDTLGKVKAGLEKNSMSFDYYYNPFMKPRNGKPLVLYEATSSLNTARNFYGIQGSLSYLLELRGRGIGFENINRRLNSGLIGVEVILKDFYENSEKIKILVKRNRDISKLLKNTTQVKEESKSYPLINIKKGTLEEIPIIYIKSN